jgi:hypothetical protein
MPGTIRFNGEQLNADVRELNWTDQDENAYYLFNTGGDLAVYNLGAYVMSISPTIAGVTGAIVSKKMLKVNFARNSILESQCPVWKEINAVIVSNRVKKVRAAQRRLSSNERIATLRDLRDGVQSLEDVRTLGLFETTSDKVLRFDDIKKNTLPWVFAESGDRLADKWMQGGVALCINEEVLSALSYRGPEKDFFRWIISRCSDNHNIVESFDGVSKLHLGRGLAAREHDGVEEPAAGAEPIEDACEFALVLTPCRDEVRVVAVPAMPGAALTEHDGRERFGIVGQRERNETAHAQHIGARGLRHGGAARHRDLAGETRGAAAQQCGRARSSTKKRRSECSPFLPMLNDATGR